MASESTHAAITHVAQAARIRPRRSMLRFAQEEILLPRGGPFEGMRFDPDRLPWTRLWLEAIDSARWRRFVLTGCGQGGKTLIGSAMPLLYHLFERRETVIYGAPSIDMCNDKYRQDILPLIESSAYRDLLPESGRGSRGGAVTSLQFRHGPTLRFMSGGGGDKTRAGFTSRVAVITESDGFDAERENSREADAFSQIEARTAAWGDRAIIFQECTVSTEEGRTWKELKSGTDSKLILKCPHCSGWGTPEREHLSGWQDAASAIEARQAAALHCPVCGAVWSEQDRTAANLSARLLHRGQQVGQAGEITGIAAPSTTFSMRFNAANNLLVPMARVAEEELSAPRTTDPSLAEKKLRQFFWTIPSEAESLTLSEVDASAIAARVADIPRGRVPADCVRLVVAVDVGKWLSHWVCVAWRPGGTPHIVEYGRIEVPSQGMAEELAIQIALRRFRDEICAAGFPTMNPGAANVRPSVVLIDSGNWESVIVSFCNESVTTGARYLPCKGFGVQQIGRRAKLADPGYELCPQPAGHQLLEVNADHWKSFVHNRLQTPTGQPGALTLYHATPTEHLSFSKHMTSEKRVEEFIAGRGLVSRWEKVNRNNHWLDALALACVAGHGSGAAAIGTTPPPAPREEGTERPRQHRDLLDRDRDRGALSWLEGGPAR